ncbi:hypothetical protein CONLIGDRAFT_680044 [Coniochaeta ligniaria NRRL 30616]|uniref:Uncharacterized protein n=1 Tax=Coniochaeta ligniaria NRRL 30616 TaxID=1408157 RepID=A0A1J7IV15_9PEZI|nr:hypothetical protein CONLIGDRAFT_680044 [Coniochaeta ligniaria NRRL 30616]
MNPLALVNKFRAQPSVGCLTSGARGGLSLKPQQQVKFHTTPASAMPAASNPPTPPKDQKLQLDMQGRMASAAAMAKTCAVDHPYLASGVVVVVGMVAMPGVVTAPVLGLLGFGSGGVAAGSIAASAQAGIGNVVAPSAFATLQSAGAGGAGIVVVNTVVQGAGVLVGGVTAAAQALSGRVKHTSDHGSDVTRGGLKAKL